MILLELFFSFFKIGAFTFGGGYAMLPLIQEEALRRGCVACYAAEGAYPPTLEYLQQHYGVQIDSRRYAVHYDIFAENLMPDITILENQP